MNPLTNVKNINKLNEIELTKGTVNKKSWHDLYKGSAWIFIGGLAYGLTEGDILCVFSQYGEIVNINHVRDKKTGKTKGFCFLCYANQKSTILAVDNLNGIKLCGRTIRVDHVANYKPPKDNEHDDEITKMLKSEGCAPKPVQAESSIPSDKEVQKKKHKKHKKEKKKKHKKRKRVEPDEEFSLANVKKEKIDEGYSKYEFPGKFKNSSKKDESSESKSSSDSSESDSTHISRKIKSDSYKTHPSTSEKLDRREKSGPDKYDKHKIENSKHKSRKENDLSSESDNESSKKRISPHIFDRTNGLSLESRGLKEKKKGHQKYEGSNSSSDENSERHRMDHRNPKNKEHIVERSNSRRHRHDSSSGSEKDLHFKENTRTMSKEREKYRRRDSLERDRRKQDSHSSYRDQRGRESPYKTDRQSYRRDSSERYERYDKYKDNKRDYGKYHSERKGR
ncbi:RNA-binding motif protein like [Argiope bruennichi]|uniref:RNA-binding motif protein, X-linked 2 n=1 Tax=Argiope bruennichi TaxID=94029 RepID=A0A8T0E264_ARGBR|nr:RNA-binding motif protein like [Argiope bruennichi]